MSGTVGSIALARCEGFLNYLGNHGGVLWLDDETLRILLYIGFDREAVAACVDALVEQGRVSVAAEGPIVTVRAAT